MGGLALKNTYTRRCNKDEFNNISNELLTILREEFPKVDIPLFFSSKDSFGDIDIVVSTDGFDSGMYEYIVSTFEPNEIYHNGNSYSFDYKEIQIDLIVTSSENFNALYHYLCYNDLGNFMGRIAQKLGLKYGQEGLWYNHFFKDVKGKIPISKNHRKIFEFLGFDYDRWLDGFEKLEDIFDYVINSKYFDSDIYELKHLNKINRERNRKRKSYMSFLDYIKDKCPNKHYDFKDKSEYLKMAKDFFSETNIEENIRYFEYQVTKKRLINVKFNGGHIIEKYNIKGKELGQLINGFKEWVVKSYNISYDEYILNTPVEEIHNAFDIFKIMEDEKIT